MQKRVLTALASVGVLSAVFIFTQVSSEKEETVELKKVATVVVEEEIYASTKVLSKPKVQASKETKSFVNTMFEKIKDGKLNEISREDIQNLIAYFQDSTDLDKAYADIVALYQLNLPESSKIFLLSLLGDVSTGDAAKTLLKLLDLDTDASMHLAYEGRKAIRDLIYDDTLGKVNVEVSSALQEYWKTSSNDNYRADVEQAIFKIGEPIAVEEIVNTLNDSSTSTAQARSIASAMSSIRNEETTAMLVAKYNNTQNSAEFNSAYLKALPLISNEVAINALYDWSTTVSSAEIVQVQDSFTTVQQRNPHAENIVKDRLYDKSTNFTSDEVKTSIEKIFKQGEVEKV